MVHLFPLRGNSCTSAQRFLLSMTTSFWMPLLEQTQIIITHTREEEDVEIIYNFVLSAVVIVMPLAKVKTK